MATFQPLPKNVLIHSSIDDFAFCSFASFHLALFNSTIHICYLLPMVAQLSLGSNMSCVSTFFYEPSLDLILPDVCAHGCYIYIYIYVCVCVSVCLFCFTLWLSASNFSICLILFSPVGIASVILKVSFSFLLSLLRSLSSHQFGPICLWGTQCPAERQHSVAGGDRRHWRQQPSRIEVACQPGTS